MVIIKLSTIFFAVFGHLVDQGKSTLAWTLGRELHTRDKLTYVLDCDNLRHGLNKGSCH
ncbi:hypothetical protein BDA96_01G134600 [Sorghum bicolor]|uniref:APS kinase domain-containing protein n=1 Tax=Sorghum bicolor TaxID=4558 RepID=A0A921UXH6_SORBI|nr:hypothetical protein BDA96_01G134600 [Sorghum bicolor]